jgi:hypothetical protein
VLRRLGFGSLAELVLYQADQMPADKRKLLLDMLRRAAAAGKIPDLQRWASFPIVSKSGNLPRAKNKKLRDLNELTRTVVQVGHTKLLTPFVHDLHGALEIEAAGGSATFPHQHIHMHSSPCVCSPLFVCAAVSSLNTRMNGIMLVVARSCRTSHLLATVAIGCLTGGV